MSTRPRCLIVDDNPHYLRSARRLLERQGYEVLSAGTSGTALALAGSEDPDVTLVDVHLGPEDGVALADELVHRGTGGRVVLLSTVGGDDLAEVVAGSSAVGFLPKDVLSRNAIEALGEPEDPGRPPT